MIVVTRLSWRQRDETSASGAACQIEQRSAEGPRHHISLRANMTNQNSSRSSLSDVAAESFVESEQTPRTNFVSNWHRHVSRRLKSMQRLLRSLPRTKVSRLANWKPTWKRKLRATRGEQLEARQLLTTFSPDILAIDGAPNSLRAAIIASNTNGQDDVINLGAGYWKLVLPNAVGQENAAATGD